LPSLVVPFCVRVLEHLVERNAQGVGDLEGISSDGEKRPCSSFRPVSRGAAMASGMCS
jgi:hypothetical protein